MTSFSGVILHIVSIFSGYKKWQFELLQILGIEIPVKMHLKH